MFLEGQGRSFFIVLYVVVELISSNAAFQFGVQIGIDKLFFGGTLHIRVIGQGHGAAFVDGLHHLGFGFGFGLRASGLAPEGFIAVFYTGLGASLLTAGLRFLLAVSRG